MKPQKKMKPQTKVKPQKKIKPQKKGVDSFAKLMEGVEIPAGYDVEPSGVYRINKEGDDDRISELPLVAKAYTRDTNSDNWKILLAWISLDGKIREEAYDTSFVVDRKPMIKELLQKGYKVKSNTIKAFQNYLEELEPPKRMLHVDKLGWYDNNEGKLSFVLPNKVIGNQQEEEIHFQPDSYAPTLDSMTSKGSFKQWQSEVAEKTKGNPLLIFCLSAAFAGPLIKMVGAETGGFHIYGKTSRGKTTAMQVAASVWGNGESPTKWTTPTFIRTWAATTNALEGIAAAHNDTLMILDELGQCDATDFQKIVYNLSAGQGKARMNKSANLTAPKTWRSIYLSTGELTAKNRLESAKNKAKGGQMIRLVDIPIDDGIIIETGKLSSREFATTLGENCSKHYGWAGPAFVKRFLEEVKGDPDKDLQDLEDNYKFYQEQLKEDGLQPEQNRILDRLALVWLAGKLACDFEILPLDEVDDIWEAMKYIKRIWLQANLTISDTTRIAKEICDFIARNKDRFVDWEEKWEDKKDSAGYKRNLKEKQLYLFHTSFFLEEFCQSTSVKSVCDELIENNFLFQMEKDRHAVRFERDGEKIPFYAINSKILSHDFGE